MNRRTLILLLLTATLRMHNAAQAADDKGGLSFAVESEGFSLNPTLTSVTIDSVKPAAATATATAGLQVGDAIVSAQGIAVAGSKADVLKQAFNRKVGETLRLVIVRGAAKPREVTLVAARRP